MLLAEKERRRRERLRLPLVDLIASYPLGQIIPGAGKAMRPYHLEPFAICYQRAFQGARYRMGLSVPPQHGKTSLALFGIAQALAARPHIRIAYVTYAAGLAIERSKAIREVTENLGCEIRSDINSGQLWKTTVNGMLAAGGIDGQFTGRGFDVIVFDDPYKGRQQANSPVHRQKVEDLIRGTLLPRLAPNGSIFLIHTRWHSDDAIGVRSRDPDWQIMNLPAVCEDESSDPLRRRMGAALWPEFKPVSALREAQKDAYEWASLYQGRPRPREGSLFGDPSFYESAPERMKIVVGIDLAYSERTQSDYSVAVVLGGVQYEDRSVTPPKIRTRAYVLGVLRKQLKSTDFVRELRRFLLQWRGAPCYGYLYGTEKGAADHMVEQGVRIRLLKKEGDKFVRAQSAAAAWDRGDLLLPADKEWVPDFVDELTSFTGANSRNDDQVDAMVAAYDALNVPKSSPMVVQSSGAAIDVSTYAGGRGEQLETNAAERIENDAARAKMQRLSPSPPVAGASIEIESWQYSRSF